MSGIGNVFAHRLFTHLVRPPEEKKKKREEEERNWNGKEEKKRRIREKEKEKHRNTSGIVLGFHQKMWPQAWRLGRGLVDLAH